MGGKGEGGAEFAPTPVVSDSEKPGLFRVKIGLFFMAMI